MKVRAYFDFIITYYFIFFILSGGKKKVDVMVTRLDAIIQQDTRCPEASWNAAARVVTAAAGNDVLCNASWMATSRCRHAPPPPPQQQQQQQQQPSLSVARGITLQFSHPLNHIS